MTLIMFDLKTDSIEDIRSRLEPVCSSYPGEWAVSACLDEGKQQQCAFVAAWRNNETLSSGSNLDKVGEVISQSARITFSLPHVEMTLHD